MPRKIFKHKSNKNCLTPIDMLRILFDGNLINQKNLHKYNKYIIDRKDLHQLNKYLARQTLDKSKCSIESVNKQMEEIKISDVSSNQMDTN